MKPNAGGAPRARTLLALLIATAGCVQVPVHPRPRSFRVVERANHGEPSVTRGAEHARGPMALEDARRNVGSSAPQDALRADIVSGDEAEDLERATPAVLAAAMLRDEPASADGSGPMPRSTTSVTERPRCA